jgi:hypothetical protein
MRRSRLSEDISLVAYVGFTLMLLPYIDSRSRPLLATWTGIVMHVFCVAMVCAILILGMRLAIRFCEYGMWGWRETVAVGFLGIYSITGYLVRPCEPLLREAGWIICVLIQGIILMCAQYLECWFHDAHGEKRSKETQKLIYQACWHIFAACWTASAAAIVVAGVVIGFAGSTEIKDAGKEPQGKIVVVIVYLLLTVLPVFLWMMRPCFQKSLRITRELEEENQ